MKKLKEIMESRARQAEEYAKDEAWRSVNSKTEKDIERYAKSSRQWMNRAEIWKEAIGLLDSTIRNQKENR